MLHLAVVTKESDMLGAECALCKEPFAPRDEVVECPVDGALHHTFCWVANGNHCTSLGCHGHGSLTDDEDDLFAGAVLEVEEVSAESTAPTPATPPSSRRQNRNRSNNNSNSQLPFHLRIAQSCLMISIAIAIIVMAFSCFGIWAIVDYLMLEVFEYGYR